MGSVLSGAERHIGRSLRFRWWVGVFNRWILRTGVFFLGVSMWKRPFPDNCQLSIVNCQLKTPKTGFLMRFRQSEADGDGVVYHGHLLVVEPSHVFSQAAFVDGADLFQEDHGVLG